MSFRRSRRQIYSLTHSAWRSCRLRRLQVVRGGNDNAAVNSAGKLRGTFGALHLPAVLAQTTCRLKLSGKGFWTGPQPALLPLAWPVVRRSSPTPDSVLLAADVSNSFCLLRLAPAPLPRLTDLSLPAVLVGAMAVARTGAEPTLKNL
ncbi:hypothetical protein PCASD_20632 [Puccinia coronata f. sp. avenae]|uniref:Uncharacterized protein n=1 Tax=Puccinia coronata f. sp. avenae TaxID=200324 RepID=A0A2N5SI07_9BASI|nr:hypothetical protein PCASD_25151 [Puccinia coronata f. sp. avenae]PLW31525.1 hypothetical protein PCASD_20632 [Puccinia coronata f. sp. avenae]